jgi:hypothetical protein
MTRDDALDYLKNEFSEQIADTGMSDTDSPDGFEQVINNALRQIGTAKADFDTADVAEDEEAAYTAFLEFFALRRFTKASGPEHQRHDERHDRRAKGAFDNVQSFARPGDRRGQAVRVRWWVFIRLT